MFCKNTNGTFVWVTIKAEPNPGFWIKVVNVGGKSESGVETGKVEQSIVQVSVGNRAQSCWDLWEQHCNCPTKRWVGREQDSFKVSSISLLIWLTSGLPTVGLYNPLDRECPQAGRQRKTWACLQIVFRVGSGGFERGHIILTALFPIIEFTC